MPSAARLWGIFAAVLFSALLSPPALAAPRHGLAMQGDPALPPGFAHLPYANPDAPQGGQVVFGETGGFDSLNPFILKGTAPWGVQAHVTESLLARSWDEPFTLYGLLAESVETPEDRAWVEFTLRPQARFADGSPVTVADVVFSMQITAAQGRPAYGAGWAQVSGWRQTGPRSVRFDFVGGNRELPLILGLRPILKQTDWAGRTFSDSTLQPFLGSGPYRIGAFEPGRFIEFVKRPDYWGRDLGVNRGLNNFATIRYEYFRNQEALWEAVKTGAVSIFNDTDPVRWAEGYDFPAALDGRLARVELAHQRPSGMRGFVLNTRRAPFDNADVRRALALSFDWEWINRRLYRGEFRRITSYFGNSPLAFRGPADAAESALLAPFALGAEVLAGDLAPPVSDGSGRNRANLRTAADLLDRAGWPVQAGQRRNAAGVPLTFEILVGSSSDETLANLWGDGLARLGIETRVRLVDASQFQQRRTDYDYDVTVANWVLSLSPGTEQWLYFGSNGRTRPGTRNYMGVADPAVDAMITALLAAKAPRDFTAAVHALDRVLTAGRYVIPFGMLRGDRIAFQAGFDRPGRGALYGWRPEVWWARP